MKLSIVIPVYNSSDSLRLILQEIEHVTHKLSENEDYEVIFVDDGSPSPRTKEALNQLALEFPRLVKVFTMNENIGQQAALYQGLLQCSGEYALTIDDDLQHDFSAIEAFYQKAKEGADLSFGIYEAYGDGPSREWGSKIIGAFFKWRYQQLGGKRVSSMRFIHRSVYERLPKKMPKFVYLSAELIPFAQKIENITVTRRARVYGKSGYTLRKCVKIGLQLTWYYGILNRKKQD